MKGSIQSPSVTTKKVNSEKQPTITISFAVFVFQPHSYQINEIYYQSCQYTRFHVFQSLPMITPPFFNHPCPFYVCQAANLMETLHSINCPENYKT